MNPLLTVIIINWNAQEYIVDCIRSVLKSDYSNLEIIFIDNCSTDGSLTRIHRAFNSYEFNRIRRVYNSKNYGCPYAEPGYFPGGTRKNVMGFGMVTSRHRQHPVLCRAIRGSRNDTLTVQDVVNHLKAWGFKRLTLIMDRGMISRENVEFIMKSGFDLVGLVPETNKEVWDYIARWPTEKLERPKYLLLDFETEE